MIVIFLEANNSDSVESKQSASPKSGRGSVNRIIVSFGTDCSNAQNVFDCSKNPRKCAAEKEKPQDMKGSDINEASLHQLMFQHTGTEIAHTRMLCIHTQGTTSMHESGFSI